MLNLNGNAGDTGKLGKSGAVIKLVLLAATLYVTLESQKRYHRRPGHCQAGDSRLLRL